MKTFALDEETKRKVDEYCKHVDAVKAEYESQGKTFDIDEYFKGTPGENDQFWITEWKMRQH